MTDKEYNIHNKIANLILAVFALLGFMMIYTTYMLHFHGNGWIYYTNIPFPTSKSSYKSGEMVEYFTEYHQNRNTEKIVTRTIKSACGDSYDYLPVYFSNAGELGLWTWWEKSTVIPEWFKPCDRAWITGTATYTPNHFREIKVGFRTQEFTIIK